MVTLLLALLLAAPELSFEGPGPMARALGQTSSVAADSSGTTWLVAWEAPGRLGVERPVVMATRVSGAGQVLDPSGIQLSSPFGSAPSVSWIASEGGWIVTWETDGESLLRLVRPDGSRTPVLTLGSGRSPASMPATGGFMVLAEAGAPALWRVQSPLQLLDTNAQTIPSQPLPWATPVRGDPAGRVLWAEAGTLWLSTATLAAGFGGQPVGLHPAARLDGLVSEGDATRFIFRAAPTAAFETAVFVPGQPVQATPLVDAGIPSRAHASGGLTDDATALTLVFENGRAWAHLARDGGVSAGQPLMVPGFVYDARLSAGASGFLLSAATANDGLLVQRRLGDLAPLDLVPIQASTSPGGHAAQLVAAHGPTALFAYHRLTADAELVVRRTDAVGTPIGGPELVVASSRVARPRLLTLGASTALFVGNALRLSSGPGLWSPPRPLSPALDYVGLSGDATGRLVVSGLLFVAGGEYEGWALREEPDGGLSQHLLFPVSGPKPQWPQLAFQPDGGEALAICNTSERVYATRLTGALDVLGTAAVELFPATAINASVVSDALDGFVIVYTDYNSIYARRVVQGVAGPHRLLAEGSFEIGPALSFRGMVLVPSVNRESGALAVSTLAIRAGDLELLPGVELVAPSSAVTSSPTLAAMARGLAVTYGRLELDAGVPTTRYQFLTPLGPGSPCVVDWQCDGRCAAGRCISTGGDAGLQLDAGDTDGGANEPGDGDAGAATPGDALERFGRTYRAGCDCAHGGLDPGMMLLALLARRRRR